MEKKLSNRWANSTKAERTLAMSKLARAKQAKMSDKERKEFARMMVERRGNSWSMVGGKRKYAMK